MRKIRLDPGQLHVATFDTTPREADTRGTVHGQWSQPGTCDAYVATCQAGGTCARTCGSKCTTGTVL